ncbi:MAG: acyl-CoA dehydrogenase family protein, partial [Pseudomonadota bacterium]
ARLMAQAGAFRLLTPNDIGGLETTPRAFAETLEAYAQGDASAAWCAMIGSTSAMNAAYLARETAEEIFGDPNVITGGVFAPMGKAQPVEGGYRISGRWQWGSGSPNCSWLSGGCVIVEDGDVRRLPNGAPDSRMAIFPRAEAELIDTWHVAGLKGTGSGDFAVEDLFVPADRTVSIVTDAPVATGALYAFPPFGILSVGVASVAMGAARAALDAIVDLASAKRSQGSKKTLAERQTVQRDVAQLTAHWRAARAFLFNEIDLTWDVAQAEGNIPMERRADLRLACTHMTRTAAEVARGAYDLGGGAALYLDSELQRRFRDTHAATQHICTAPATYELMGRILLGLPTDAGMV